MGSTNQHIKISKKLPKEHRKEAWEQVLHAEKKKEVNVQPYQRRKQA